MWQGFPPHLGDFLGGDEAFGCRVISLCKLLSVCLGCWHNGGSRLGQRLRRWPSLEPAFSCRLLAARSLTMACLSTEMQVRCRLSDCDVVCRWFNDPRVASCHSSWPPRSSSLLTKSTLQTPASTPPRCHPGVVLQVTFPFSPVPIHPSYGRSGFWYNHTTHTSLLIQFWRLVICWLIAGGLSAIGRWQRRSTSFLLIPSDAVSTLHSLQDQEPSNRFDLLSSYAYYLTSNWFVMNELFRVID